MKHLIISLIAILLFANVSFSQSTDTGDKCAGLDKRVAALVSQYKELRDRRRRLAEGVYDEDLSADGGKLHQVMYSLGEELGHPPYTKRSIIGCLGEPDAIKSNEQMGNLLDIYNRELKKAGRKVEVKPEREYLIYFWRGWHDFIFFIVEGGVVVDHGWWFAYE